MKLQFTNALLFQNTVIGKIAGEHHLLHWQQIVQHHGQTGLVVLDICLDVGREQVQVERIDVLLEPSEHRLQITF